MPCECAVACVSCVRGAVAVMPTTPLACVPAGSVTNHLLLLMLLLLNPGLHLTWPRLPAEREPAPQHVQAAHASVRARQGGGVRGGGARHGQPTRAGRQGRSSKGEAPRQEAFLRGNKSRLLMFTDEL